MTEDEIRDFINGHNWKFAKTYAKFAPHEYVVKDKIDEPSRYVLEKFALFIRLCGFDAYFGKDVPDNHHMYYEIDGYYYWTMNEPISEVEVLNRAKVEQYAIDGRRMYFRGYRKWH